MRVSLPRPWSLSLWPCPPPAFADRYAGLPSGGVVLALWRPAARRGGRYGEAFWDPGSGLWSLLSLGSFSAVPSGDPGLLGPVVASLCLSLGLAPSGRVAGAVLAAVPSDGRGLALALGVMES